ncbi:unnamed protein product [Moneuplotes crassus]|uniref:EF-hand domain-containing protein n=1 Tax=Euplotes crassus TaxID=5936 RepID=A0AAD1XWX7_EUPCR|nr:unnamed protein product [Moneuplotes crassus]
MRKLASEETKGHQRLESKESLIVPKNYQKSVPKLEQEAFITEISDLGFDGSAINFNQVSEPEIFNSTDLKDDIICAFQIFDREETGLISLDKLRLVITHFGNTMEPEEAELLLASIQDFIIKKNGKKYVDYYTLFSPEEKPNKSFCP